MGNVTIEALYGHHPVSIVRATMPSRRAIMAKCEPSLRGLGAQELITLTSRGPVSPKRNRGAQLASKPLILFSDDDIHWPADWLATAVSAISTGADVVYSGYHANVKDTSCHPLGSHTHNAPEYDAGRLREQNYIGTNSLVRAGVLHPFDERLDCLEDWDFWLTLQAAGAKFKRIEPMFTAHYTDQGISSRDTTIARKLISKKHGL